MKENKNILNLSIVLMLFLIEFSTLFFMYYSFDNKNQLNNINYDNKKIKNSDKMFAVMVEQTKGEEDYKEENWSILTKSGYTYNSSKSGCVDGDGKTIPGALTYTNGKASVITDSSSFCFLYFNKD